MHIQKDEMSDPKAIRFNLELQFQRYGVEQLSLKTSKTKFLINNLRHYKLRYQVPASGPNSRISLY